jgi:hypothetical protein
MARPGQFVAPVVKIAGGRALHPRKQNRYRKQVATFHGRINKHDLPAAIEKGGELRSIHSRFLAKFRD